MEYSEMYCKYFCTAPSTECEHWQGTFCDLDLEKEIMKPCIDKQEEL